MIFDFVKSLNLNLTEREGFRQAKFSGNTNYQYSGLDRNVVADYQRKMDRAFLRPNDYETQKKLECKR